MTYNFDPDRWLANEMAYVRHRQQKGALTAAEAKEAIAALEKRHGEMCARLDGTYQINPTAPETTP